MGKTAEAWIGGIVLIAVLVGLAVGVAFLVKDKSSPSMAEPDQRFTR
jgi:hypothetical protein